MKTLIYIILFIILTTLNFEYLINRQSSTLLTLSAVVIELGLVYILIVPHFKKLLK